jgi:RHS repeat-associated protein
LTATEHPNDTRLTLERSAGGRVSRLAVSRNGIEEKSLELTYQDGLVAQRLDSTYGTPETFQYDAANRIASHVFAQGESELLSYDPRSRLIGRQLVASDLSLVGDVGYSFDLANRPLDLSLDGASEVAWSYLDGLLSSMSYGNGLVRSYLYSDLAAGMLVSSQTVSPTLGIVSSTSHTYAAANGQTDISVETCTEAPLDACTGEYSALRPTDQTGAPAGPQLHAASLEYWGDGAMGELVDRDYQYDHLKNLVSDDAVDNPGVEWQYNAERNRLLASADHTYSYDDAGYVTARDSVPITWDAIGLIASIGPASFVWDLGARPVSADNGILEVHYLFGGMVRADVSGTPIELELGKLRVRLATGEKRYRHLDFRGNVKFVTDEGGNPVLHYGYSGYKVEVIFGDDSDRRSFVEGTELGDDLYVLGVRVYDGSAGRFLSPDPIFQVVNQNSYAEGNPIWLSDPDGMAPGVRAGVRAGEAAATYLGMTGVGVTTVGAAEVLSALRAGASTGAGGIAVAIGLSLIAIAVAITGASDDPEDPTPPGQQGRVDIFFDPAASLDSSPGSSFCSPETIVEVPDLSWLLMILVPLQLLLACALVRSRGFSIGTAAAALGIGARQCRLDRGKSENDGEIPSCG